MLAHIPDEALTVRFAGHVITGGCVSFTVTVKVHVLLLPLLSRAVLVTVVVPRGKAKPLAGLLVMLVTAQLSVAVTIKVTLLVHTPSVAFTTRLLEQVITGDWVSFTLTVKLQVLLLPCVSVAVLVTVVVPTRKLLPLAGELTTLTPGQLSAAVTTKVTLLEHVPENALTTRLVEQVIVGNSVSLTVTVKLQLLVLPCASVAVLVTVVVPAGKLLPLAGTLTTLTPGQLSAAVTTKVTLLAHVPVAAFTTRLVEQVITGSSRSLTVTVNVHCAVFPPMSTAVLVTVVIPTGKADPLGGTLSTPGAPQLSLAVTVNVTLLAQAPDGAVTVRFAGQVIVGGWVSMTVTVKRHWLTLPLLSRAVLITVVVPTGKEAPLGGVLEMLATPQLSVAVTL